MNQQGPNLNFEAVCKYAGQLYLESRHEIEVLTAKLAELQAQAAQLAKERDDALRLAVEKKAA